MTVWLVFVAAALIEAGVDATEMQLIAARLVIELSPDVEAQIAREI